MFLPHSKIECVVCFFTGTEDGMEPAEYEIDMDAPGIDRQLESAVRLAKSTRRDHGLYPSEFVNEETKLDNVNRFRAAVAEYKVKKNAKKQVFNIDYVAGKLSLYISNFAQYRIEQDYDYAEKQLIEEMRGVSPSYFAFIPIFARPLGRALGRGAAPHRAEPTNRRFPTSTTTAVASETVPLELIDVGANVR